MLPKTVCYLLLIRVFWLAIRKDEAIKTAPGSFS